MRYCAGVTATPDPTEWYSIPEISEFLGLRQRDVRVMMADAKLFAVRRGVNNALAISGDQIVSDGATCVVLPAIRGTLMSLRDAGYSDEEAAQWMHRDNDELGATPMEALRSGKTHAVRRVIAGLAF